MGVRCKGEVGVREKALDKLRGARVAAAYAPLAALISARDRPSRPSELPAGKGRGGRGVFCKSLEGVRGGRRGGGAGKSSRCVFGPSKDARGRFEEAA